MAQTFRHDRDNAQEALNKLGALVNYIGYVETRIVGAASSDERDVGIVRESRVGERGRSGRYGLSTPESVWDAIRAFFSQAGRGGRSRGMTETLQRYATLLETLAKDNGLDYYPVQFEEVPSSFMMEVAVYGLPVRMPHWSFGVRYIYQLIQHRMGHSRLFEVVFPGNPGRAYLAGNNSLQENTLVTAHVLGHADFAKNNALFKRSQEQVGYRIVEQAAAHARQIGQAVEEHGQTRVEQVLDAALALEAHIDTVQALRRERLPAVRERSAQLVA